MSLDRLSAECFAVIAHFLPYRSVQALEVVGSPAILSKLFRGVSEIRAQVGPMQKWTHAAFDYPLLRYLRLENAHSRVFPPFVALSDHLLAPRVHTALETLIVQSSLGALLLQPSTDQESLCTLLPCLKRLSIMADTIEARLRFDKLPSTLTDFSVDSIMYGGQAHDFSDLSALPRGLLRLSLAQLHFCTNEEESIDFLPPRLQLLHLMLETAHSSKKESLPILLSIIPPTMTSLRLMLQRVRAESLMVGSLPPALESFSLELNSLPARNSAKVTLEVPLPPNFRSLKITPECESNLAGFRLPSGLTSLCLDRHARVADLDDLPTTLTHLAIRNCNKAFSIENLTRLTSLRLSSVATSRLCISQASTWGALHSRLESLHIGTSLLASAKPLLGPWTRLAELRLELQRPPPDLLDMPRAWLPTTLQTLTIADQVRDNKNKVPFYWPLMSHNKSLKSVTYEHSNGISGPILSEFGAELPDSLEILNLSIMGSIPTTLLHDLPAGLKELILRISYLSEGHFVALPPQLSTLEIYTGDHSSIAIPPEMLPRQLIYVSGVKLPPGSPFKLQEVERRRQQELCAPDLEG